MNHRDFSRSNRALLCVSLLAQLLAAPSALAATGQAGAVRVEELTPSVLKVFTKESTAIIFTAKVLAPQSGGNASEPKLSLYQVDETGKPVRYFGIFTDDGVMGDRTAHDGIYSRKVQFHDKKPGVRAFAVMPDAGEVQPTTDSLPSSAALATTQIEVIGRPSMLQALSGVWEKIRRGFASGG